ncbi:hypothetical protein SAMN05444266_104355 [Chitinophaga jiangningensis]|uniref:Uncharacterized protein n=1 Tax=Chitinophaga jiangningensis TaxID=1419482 RepID=A0A1M7CKN1_9BACT|nr:hypothetical protein SAMN05444266_104355 [Chitinophaga jiangningensis]
MTHVLTLQNHCLLTYWQFVNTALVLQKISFFHFLPISFAFENGLQSLLVRHAIGANGCTFKIIGV